jgi:hypothetical protein
MKHRGLAVSLKLLDLDHEHSEAFPAITITHPARPDRGTVILTDDAAVLRLGGGWVRFGGRWRAVAGAWNHEPDGSTVTGGGLDWG